MDNNRRQELIAAACEVRQRAYAKYSDFQVGSALRTTTGRIFVGCNVENVSYGLTVCAERVAVASAVAAGEHQFEALAIATAGGATPCGACRQVLAEFCEDLLILLIDVDNDGEVREVRLGDLLPARFSLPP